jgi:hypothetical protein
VSNKGRLRNTGTDKIIKGSVDQRYIIPYEKVDTELLSVRIKPNIQST